MNGDVWNDALQAVRVLNYLLASIAKIPGSSSLTIKAILSAETFGSEMRSGMFQLIAQRRIGRFMLTDSMKSSTK